MTHVVNRPEGATQHPSGGPFSALFNMPELLSASRFEVYLDTGDQALPVTNVVLEGKTLCITEFVTVNPLISATAKSLSVVHYSESGDKSFAIRYLLREEFDIVGVAHKADEKGLLVATVERTVLGKVLDQWKPRTPEQRDRLEPETPMWG